VIASLSDDDLDQPITNAGGKPALSKVGYITAMIDEFSHHGAELGVLRDLYAHVHQDEPRFGDPPNLAKVAWAGMWHLIPQLIEAGADVNAESDGATALHLACAAGEREIIELLLDRGADSPLGSRTRAAQAKTSSPARLSFTAGGVTVGRMATRSAPGT
jgi:hypothetical protein